MITLWIRDRGRVAPMFTPIALVELRKPEMVPYPPQATGAVGVNFHIIGESRRGCLSDSGSRVAFLSEAAGIRRLSSSRMAIRSSRAATTTDAVRGGGIAASPAALLFYRRGAGDPGSLTIPGRRLLGVTDETLARSDIRGLAEARTTKRCKGIAG